MTSLLIPQNGSPQSAFPACDFGPLDLAPSLRLALLGSDLQQCADAILRAGVIGCFFD
jgi:hypothetical protein